MEIFLAILIFQIEVGSEPSLEQFDEQIRLINANNVQEALTIAQTIGKSEELEFTNSSNQKVNWIFVGTTNVVNLSRKKSGEIIDSRHYEFAELNGFKQLQTQKAFFLEKTSHFQLNEC